MTFYFNISSNCVLDGESCVVYSNDDSLQSGVCSYIVQSLTINGKPRTFLTFGVITESISTLAELMKTPLDILSAASGNKYSSTDIVKKIDFVMTDSSAHNLKVIEKVKISYEDCFSFH